jgi:hypothetical protein
MNKVTIATIMAIATTNMSLGMDAINNVLSNNFNSMAHLDDPLVEAKWNKKFLKNVNNGAQSNEISLDNSMSFVQSTQTTFPSISDNESYIWTDANNIRYNELENKYEEARKNAIENKVDFKSPLTKSESEELNQLFKHKIKCIKHTNTLLASQENDSLVSSSPISNHSTNNNTISSSINDNEFIWTNDNEKRFRELEKKYEEAKKNAIENKIEFKSPFTKLESEEFNQLFKNNIKCIDIDSPKSDHNPNINPNTIKNNPNKTIPEKLKDQKDSNQPTPPLPPANPTPPSNTNASWSMGKKVAIGAAIAIPVTGAAIGATIYYNKKTQLSKNQPSIDDENIEDNNEDEDDNN